MSALGGILSTVDVPGLLVTAATPGTTVTLSVSNSTIVELFTWTAGQNETVNVSGSHPVGKVLALQVTNDAIIRTVTLGTGLIGTASTIVGTALKVSTIFFLSNGTSFYEIARSTGL